MIAIMTKTKNKKRTPTPEQGNKFIEDKKFEMALLGQIQQLQRRLAEAEVYIMRLEDTQLDGTKELRVEVFRLRNAVQKRVVLYQQSEKEKKMLRHISILEQEACQREVQEKYCRTCNKHHIQLRLLHSEMIRDFIKEVRQKKTVTGKLWKPISILD
jgi:hypothetical protein